MFIKNKCVNEWWGLGGRGGSGRGPGVQSGKVLNFEAFTLPKMSISACICPFQNASRFLLMISNWGIEVSKEFSQWTGQTWGRVKYLNHDEWRSCQADGRRKKVHKQGALGNTTSSTNCICDITQNNVLCYIHNNNDLTAPQNMMTNFSWFSFSSWTSQERF